MLRRRSFRLPASLSLVPAVLLAAPRPAEAHLLGGGPAGGAALVETVIATGIAVAVMTALALLGAGHRLGTFGLLGRVGAFAGRRLDLPPWAALPTLMGTASLLTALFGMYWDISLHMDHGRDAGPLANPAHYFILGGLFGILAAGFVAVVLPEGRPGPAAIRITRHWQAPIGGVLMMACASFSLVGFPLDDVWHRLFGQDVTLWGPTHLMLIGGASLTLVALAVLQVEGRRDALEHRGSGAERGSGRWRTVVRQAGTVFTTGGFLIGLSTFQGEFDFGVPQFRLLFHPLLVVLAASIALVTARVWGGRGTALGAAVFFIVVRGAVSVLVGPVAGQTTPHLPLYLVEAGIVELLALRMSTRRPLAFGLTAGALIGTVGLGAEWGWSHLWMPIPWPASLLPAALVVALAGGLAGGVLGAFAGAALRTTSLADLRPFRLPASVAGLAVALLVGYGLMSSPPAETRAAVTLTEVVGGPERAVSAGVQVTPPDAARNAAWMTATAWQGGGLVVDRLEPLGDGRFRSTRPLPVHGSWKALLRLHTGDTLVGLPVYLPADRDIPAGEVPAAARIDRAFVPDKQLLQREARAGSGLIVPAVGVVLGLTLGLIAALAWGLVRLAGSSEAPRQAASRASAGRPSGVATA